MNPERWEEINRLYHAVLEVEERERATFLEKACSADAELRREVDTLLAYDQQGQQLMDRSALQLTAEKLAAEPVSLVGRKLGPYQIQGVLGVGGMGEVYKAKDTRLNRTVAIKVLPRYQSERADVRRRFEREARAIAGIDHPHICSLYDIGRENEIDFLVMEYLEGETLSKRLKKGPLPTEQVLRYAIEIASALDQAHRQGLIHRDLKPGNVMLTETGAKLLDFGLAKQSRSQSPDGERSPIGDGLTQTESLTEEGMLLGTVEYMAPEQLEGKEADTRTDIFALGVVIYEMATGRKAFGADSKASVIAKILTFQPPPISTIETVSPPELDVVVQKCLAKNPEERWQRAAELTPELQEIADVHWERRRAIRRGQEPSGSAIEIESNIGPAVPVAILEHPKPLSGRIRSRGWKLGLVGVLLALITGFLALWRVWQQPEKPAKKPKEISFTPLTSYAWDNPVDSAAISPDGKFLAFCSKGKLFIQVIRTGEKRSIVIPEGFYPGGVSWFPDGTKLLLGRAEERWVRVKGEMTQVGEPSLWSLSILGGAPQKIVERALSPSVSPDGSLVVFVRFDLDRKTNDIWLVGTNGEMPRKIRAPSEPGQRFYGTTWSSSGQRIFYIRYEDGKSRAIESCDLAGEKATTILSSKEDRLLRNSLCYVPDGRIVFPMGIQWQPALAWHVNLWEIKVDPATGRALSEARRFTEWSGYGHFVNADNLSITSDGMQLALLRTNAQADVYVAELEPGGKAMKSPRRLTLEESDDWVADWTADSRAVLFCSNRNGNFDLFKQDISQTDAETILVSPEQEWRPSLSPDRAFILYTVSEKASRIATRLMRIPVSGGPPELVLQGEKIQNYSCAREVNRCVVVEEVDGKQILTTFDPVKGRGEKLPALDYPKFEKGILSPQGRLIERMKSGPEGLHVRIRSLTGGAVEEITFKNLTYSYSFFGWSLDGKGIYLQEFFSPGSPKAVYAGLDGHSQVFWKHGTSPGYSLEYLTPSPNGRYLAFNTTTYESNAWMMENF